MPGVDAVYIGPSDLGFSMGLIPILDREEPQILEAYDKIIRETGKRGIAACIHCGTTAYAKRAIGMGFKLVTISNDSGLLLGAAKRAVAEVRDR